MEISLETKQLQTLSSQQIQSMAILQMSYQELLVHIDEVVRENPVLDVEEPPSGQDNRELLQKLKWLEAEDRQNQYYIRVDRDEEMDPLGRASVPFMDETLQRYIEAQLDALEIPKALLRAAKFVAANLDEDGYLRECPKELAESLRVSGDCMARAIELVRTLEPAGVGAVNLSDCLELQLTRMEDTILEIEIVRGYLDKVSKHQYGAIAKALNTTVPDVHAAIGRIRETNPKPGSPFSNGERIQYIRPDVIAVKFKDHYKIITGDYDFPELRINSYYKNLLEDNGNDKELADYLSEKMRQAKWFMSSIAQRRSTLIKCAEAILQVHEDFFSGQAQSISPLTMGELAARIGIHESTVSRAIKGKYLQCGKGLYSFRFFFSRRLGDDDISADGIKRRMRAIIDGEDKSAPLSDQKIVRLLGDEGAAISRRAVAKYRAELDIPNTAGRREYS